METAPDFNRGTGHARDALLAAVFGTEELPAHLAAEGDPWYTGVHRLASEAAQFYGGRDKLHLPDSESHPESLLEQARDQGARIVLDESGCGDNVISNPKTIPWARLAAFLRGVPRGAGDASRVATA